MNQPVIILAGGAANPADVPAWRAELVEAVDQLGFALKQVVSTAGYLAQLVDTHPVLIVVDGGSADWQSWITTPRVNAATRRIPVVVVSEDAQRRAAAQGAGAAFALAPDEIAASLPEIITAHARLLDDETHARLQSQCAEPLPPQVQEAIEKFNRGEYYRQHDLLEAQWMVEQGPVRELYRAILQVGIAYYQVTRNNPRGALKMLLRSIQWLNVLPDVCQGVDVAALRADALRLRAALEAWPTDRDLAELDRTLLSQVRVIEES